MFTFEHILTHAKQCWRQKKPTPHGPIQRTCGRTKTRGVLRVLFPTNPVTQWPSVATQTYDMYFDAGGYHKLNVTCYIVCMEANVTSIPIAAAFQVSTRLAFSRNLLARSSEPGKSGSCHGTSNLWRFVVCSPVWCQKNTSFSTCFWVGELDLGEVFQQTWSLKTLSLSHDKDRAGKVCLGY